MRRSRPSAVNFAAPKAPRNFFFGKNQKQFLRLWVGGVILCHFKNFFRSYRAKNTKSAFLSHTIDLTLSRMRLRNHVHWFPVLCLLHTRLDKNTKSAGSSFTVTQAPDTLKNTFKCLSVVVRSNRCKYVRIVAPTNRCM